MEWILHEVVIHPIWGPVGQGPWILKLWFRGFSFITTLNLDKTIISSRNAHQVVVIHSKYSIYIDNSWRGSYRLQLLLILDCDSTIEEMVVVDALHC